MLEPGLAAPGSNRSQHELFLPGITVQQRLESGQQGHV